MKSNPYSREKKALNSEMNVVPYIDVMLVLLVIFMVTAPILTTGVTVDLPQHKSDNLPSNTQLPVIVTLDKQGGLYLDYEGNSVEVAISEADLIDLLSGLHKKRQKETGEDLQVMLNADQNNQYGAIVGLMSKLQQSGISKVGLLTGSPIEKGK